MNLLVLLLVLALAAANGSNDVPKGVATLAGAGVARLKTAVNWGAATTAIGCLVSLHFASKMTALFSKGIVSAKPTPAFAAAVLTGTVAWVGLSTWRRLPVSTTHALTGSLLGAGALFASNAVQWNVLLVKVVEPLLISVLIAWAASTALAVAGRLIFARAFAAQGAPETAVEAVPVAEHEMVTVGAAPHTAITAAEAPVRAPSRGSGAISGAHWFTSGLTSFARGMNDTPKIVAIGSFALFAGMTPTVLLLAVTAAMAAGGLVVGQRMAGRLAEGVIKMRHVEGFTANLTTAVMVGLGAFEGLPMSTTHVSIGAISGTAGTSLSRIKGRTVRDFAVAWLVTPPFAAAVAALAYLAFS